MADERQQRCDVVIVGASIAGCTAATLLARAGARVALVERHADPAAFKRACTHFIQASGVPTLRRLGLADDIAAAGGLETASDVWTRWGWIHPSGRGPAGPSLNLRREKLDPLLRRTAEATEGVTLLAGHTLEELLSEGDRVTGVRATARDGSVVELRAPLTVGADGRGSRVAALAGLKASTARHERFGYWAYWEGVPTPDWPRAQLWMLDPDVAYAFPTDDGLTLLVAFPTKARQAEFRADPEGAYARYLRALPDAPPMDAGRRVSKLLGRIDVPNVSHRPVGRGVALIGDAALATDPLWGVGCGWALQTAEWLADAVAGAVTGGADLGRALDAYRRRHRAGLRGHDFLIRDYATGRRLNPIERLLFSAAARDVRFADHMEAFGTRSLPVHRFLAPGVLLRAARIDVAHRLAERRPPAQVGVAS